MRDAGDIKGFQKVLSKLSTALTLAIQGAPLEENPWGTPAEPAGEESTEEETPAESNQKQRGFTVADLVAVDIPTVPDGHELKQINTPSAPANNIEVTSYLAGCFVAGLGLPPAFFLDEKLTGPNQRAVNGKAQRKFDRRKQVAARLGRSAWQRVIAHAIASGTLPSAEGWARCDFIGPSKITIDAGREMAQEREDVARGLMTRRDHYGNRGRSWRRETDQVFEELDYILDRAKAIAAEHDIPVENVMASFGLESAKGAQPKSDPNVAPIGEDANDSGNSDSHD
jgi:capsid protein